MLLGDDDCSTHDHDHKHAEHPTLFRQGKVTHRGGVGGPLVNLVPLGEGYERAAGRVGQVISFARYALSSPLIADYCSLTIPRNFDLNRNKISIKEVKVKAPPGAPQMFLEHLNQLR